MPLGAFPRCPHLIHTNHRLTEASDSTPITSNHGGKESWWKEYEVSGERPAIEVDPVEKELVTTHELAYLDVTTERRPSVVIDDRCPFVQAKPSVLPCPPGKIDVLEVEREVERIEASKLEVLAAIERRRAPSSCRRPAKVVPLAGSLSSKHSVTPRDPRRFRILGRRSGRVSLDQRCHSEKRVVLGVEAFEKRRKKRGIDENVGVQSDEHIRVTPRCCNRVRSQRPVVPYLLEAHARVAGADLTASVSAVVVDHPDAGDSLGCVDDGLKETAQVLGAVPVQHHHRAATHQIRATQPTLSENRRPRSRPRLIPCHER